MNSQTIYDDGLLRIIGTSKGPRVYFAETRIHHWLAGVFLVGTGLAGLLFENNNERRQLYGLSAVLGSVLILDDLPDLLSYLQDTFGS